MCSEDKTKLKRILGNILTGGLDQEEENLEEIVEHMQEDPLENLKEGIFIFTAHGINQFLPTDEQDYLKNFKEAN
jgi:hypothetical protein